LPEQDNLPNVDIPFNYFIVGDEAFPLKPYLLRPYPGLQLDETKRIFNYRLSRARRTIENAFGILAARWRIFWHNIIADVETIEVIIAACLCLHNFLRTKELHLPSNQRIYCPDLYADQLSANGTVVSGEWRNDYGDSNLRRLGRTGSNVSTRTIAHSRDILADYFCSPEGSVSWQRNHVNRGSTPNE